MINTLIAIAAIAWLGQILLSGWQLRRFNSAFTRLCALGKVGVGRAGGRFKPRVIIAIAIDEQQRVVGSLCMKGLTTFARPQQISDIHGKHISELLIGLQQQTLFPHNQNCQNALSLALSHKNE